MKKDEQELIGDRVEQYLIERHGLRGRMLSCINPEHDDRNPSCIFNKSNATIYCFKCERLFNIYDIVATDYNLDVTDLKSVEEKIKEIFGMKISEVMNVRDAKREAQAGVPVYNQTIQIDESADNLIEAVNKLQKSTHENADVMNYLRGRGLTDDTIKKFKIGYTTSTMSFARMAGAKVEPFKLKDDGGCICLPLWQSDPETAERVNTMVFETFPRREPKYLKNKLTPCPYLNEHKLLHGDADDVVVVCEGYYDTMSVEQCGIDACGLIGIGTNRLTALAKDFNGLIVMSLDNDDTGKEHNQKAINELKQMGKKCGVLLPKYKDYNEQLQKDGTESLKEYLETGIERIKKEIEQDTQKELDKFNANYIGNKLTNFFEYVSKHNEIATFSAQLNELLDGGLSSGLFVIGGLSGIGKSVFALQMAVQLALSKHDVIYFSLEMSTEQQIARALSMLTFEYKRLKDEGDALLVSQLKRADTFQLVNPALDYALESLNKMRLMVLDATDLTDLSTDTIAETVEHYIELTGVKPVVFVDYLQYILNDGRDAKTRNDQNTTALKTISIKNDVPVVALSSLNRESYNRQGTLSMFKESGAIEYTADVACSLEYADMSEKYAIDGKKHSMDDVLEANNEKGLNEPVRVLLRVLKNRNGKRGNVLFDFFGAFSYYREQKLFGLKSGVNDVNDFNKVIDDILNEFDDGDDVER